MVIRNNDSLTVCEWKGKNTAKEVLSVFQYFQSQTDFISSLIEVTFGKDMGKLEVKSCFSC